MDQHIEKTTKSAPSRKLKKPQDPTRRDFLYLTAGAMGAVGAGAAAWPFINSMNPAKDTQAQASIDVNLSNIAEGQSLTVMWRGKPVVVRHRTQKEIDLMRGSTQNLPDFEEDGDRFKERPEWLVVVAICTHLGCVPTERKALSYQTAEDGGWFCACHGSRYDASGRIVSGPAPRNLEVPPYQFINDTTLRIG